MRLRKSGHGIGLCLPRQTCRVEIRMSDDLKDSLMDLAYEQNLGISELIRSILEDFIQVVAEVEAEHAAQD